MTKAEFEMISRDEIYGLLLASTRRYKMTGCFVLVIVFARKGDAVAYYEQMTHVRRFDELRPVISPAPGGMTAVVLVDSAVTNLPSNSIPNMVHISKFNAQEMRGGGAADLAIALESKIAEMAFKYFEAPAVVPAMQQESNDPDLQLGRLVRQMISLRQCRLVCATEGGRSYWYVLLDESAEKHICVGAGEVPEEALKRALASNR